MRIFRFLFKTAATIAAVLAGNVVGTEFRAMETGRPVSSLITEFEVEGKRYRNFPQPLRFYPALLLAFRSEPRLLWAFFWGFLAGRLVDERYEKALLSRIFAGLGDGEPADGLSRSIAAH